MGRAAQPTSGSGAAPGEHAAPALIDLRHWFLRNARLPLALGSEEWSENWMSDKQRKCSTAPMWWGIVLALAFTAAAVMDYNWSQGPARASVFAQPGDVR